MPKIALYSDFRDFYDYMFSSAGNEVFHRIAHDRSMNKIVQNDIMVKLGLKTPSFNRVKDQRLGSPLDNIVVYTDPDLHCGDGKILTDFNHALDAYPNHWSAPWVNTTGEYDRAESHRLLQIGNRAWWLRYSGVGGWMSNHCGETSITVEGECEALDRENSSHLAGWPLFAIDFVIPVNTPIDDDFQYVIDNGFAIDFNSAPGLRGTGMNDILSAAEIYDLICESMIDELPNKANQSA